ncbi:MAG: dihydroorotase [Myxococcota bacterium]
MPRRMLIRGARLVDPAQGIDEKRSILVENGRIAGLPKRPPKGLENSGIDGRGLWVMPGFVDMHVHLREPGHEYKETVETGARAAVAGGFTTIVAMPNTDPPNDNRSVTELIQDRARRAGLARVLCAGALTCKQQGKELSEMGELKEAGCVIFTDDGHPVMDSGLMRRGLEYASGLGLPVMAHAEDLGLSRGGSMHEGEVSTRLGLRGIPAAAEDAMVMRDIALVEELGGRLHVAHVSTAGSVRALRDARRRGAAVTGECTPHHFTLTDEACSGYDPSTKMMPPLRTRADRAALIEAMADGTISAIATDHAPHSPVEKDLEFDRAAFGIIGLETAFSLTLRLVLAGKLELSRAVELLTCGPAEILGIEAGSLKEGYPADLVLVDPEDWWTVEPEKLFSRSRNTPFAGWRLPGKVLGTWVSGRRVHSAAARTRRAGARRSR